MNTRVIGVLSMSAIVVLTLAAAYIHMWVGGILLLINAAGALALLVTLAATYFVARRARALVLIALAAYSAGSIGGWAILGPYFDLAYLTKGIELVLIAVLGFELWRTRSEIRPAVRWLVSTLVPLPGLGRVLGAGGAALPRPRGEE